MTLSNETQLSSTLTEVHKDAVTCRLCRRQFAKYTCSTCNIPYCSLTCFRSQAHNQCSETFYKKEIEADIYSGPSKTLQERQQMMELLRKFEEQAEVETLEDGNEEEVSNLINRFETVDLNSISADDLWSFLTPEEKKKFMKALNDPTSELAQQILSSEQLEGEIQKPWWEAPRTSSDDTDARNSRKHGLWPDIMNIPRSMVKPIPTGHPLVYNMSAICIAYAYITRRLGTSPLGSLEPGNPDYKEAQRLFTGLVPFLTDRKSTQLYPNLPSVITGIWSLSEPGKMTSELFALLLNDAATLLKPLKITQLTSWSGDQTLLSHSHYMPVLVLSDLNRLFLDKFQIDGQHSQDNQRRTKQNYITHKLRFYAAHILSTPSAILRSICDDMLLRAQGYATQVNDEALEVKRLDSMSSKKLVEEI